MSILYYILANSVTENEQKEEEMGLDWVAVSMNCNDKISIRKRSPGVKISDLNQTVEMCGRMNNPSAKFRSQVRADNSLLLDG